MEEKIKFKIQDSIQWYEGQLLYPHHYQQMRHEMHQLSLCYLSLSCPWYWGIRYLEIDESSLPAGIIRINRILAIFPDGSAFQKETDTGLPIELDISSLKDTLKDKELTIYLAVVKHQVDTSNASGEFPRYVSIEASSVLDENTGENPINVAKLSLRVFLCPEDKLSGRLSSFPLLKVSVQDDSFQKTDFIPPTVRFHKEELIGQYFKKLITKLRRHIAYLSARLQSLKTKDAAVVLDYYEKVYNVITSRILVLEMLYESENAHPYDMYKELNISAGTYCALNHSKIPPIFPPYDHNNLKETFDPVMHFIDEIVEAVKSPSISIIFDQEDRLFSQEIKEIYLKGESMVIGIKLGTDISHATAAAWIKGAVIASDSAIDAIKEKRILGAERELVDQIPEMGLIATQNQIFARVTIDPNFIKAGEHLRIFNASDREDSRPDSLFLYVAG